MSYWSDKDLANFRILSDYFDSIIHFLIWKDSYYNVFVTKFRCENLCPF